jgi:type I restriction enzyme S subunit
VKLPQGWGETTIAECSEAIQYGLTCTSTSHGGGYRYIRITDIQDHQIDWASVPYANEPAENASAYEVTKGDLLFARTGATVGKSYLVDDVPDHQPSPRTLYEFDATTRLCFPLSRPGTSSRRTIGSK